MSKPYPNLLSQKEQADLLYRAATLLEDLQADNLGGYSGRNRPFYILNEFRRVIEQFGGRDTGLSWSKIALESHPEHPLDHPNQKQYS